MKMTVQHRRLAGRFARNLIATIAVTAIFAMSATGPASFTADRLHVAAR